MSGSIRRRDFLIRAAAAGSAYLAAPLARAFGRGQAGTPDPNFHVFLAFGQSNMEGFPGIQPEDKIGVDPRFRMLAAVESFPHFERRLMKSLRLVPPGHVVELPGQVIQRSGHGGVFVAQQLLLHLQHLAIKDFGFTRLPLRGVRIGQVVQHQGHVWMFIPPQFSRHFERSTRERLRLGQLALA